MSKTFERNKQRFDTNIQWIINYTDPEHDIHDDGVIVSSADGRLFNCVIDLMNMIIELQSELDELKRAFVSHSYHLP